MTVLIGDDWGEISNLKKHIKEFGQLKYFLGTEGAKSEKGILLTT